MYYSFKQTSKYVVRDEETPIWEVAKLERFSEGGDRVRTKVACWDEGKSLLMVGIGIGSIKEIDRQISKNLQSNTVADNTAVFMDMEC